MGAAYAGATYFPLGFGQAGTPDSYAVENYSFFQSISSNTQVVGDIGELAYYTPTGLTGTTRDQFEFYGFFSGGYYSAPGDHGGGVGHPELGALYYYNVVVPKVPVSDSPDYTTFSMAPNVQINFPNGYSGVSGYGGGGNQYQITGNLETYYRQGAFSLTFVPILATYGFSNQNSTPTTVAGVTQNIRSRGGLSLSTAIFTAGYHITDDLWIGPTHSLNFNNVSGSFPHVKQSTEATIGPNIEYDGLGPKYNLYVEAAVTTDYIRTGGLKQNTTFFLYLFKYLTTPDKSAKTVTARY